MIKYPKLLIALFVAGAGLNAFAADAPADKAAGPSKSHSPSKPNIVLLFADDMRWDMVRALGQNKQIQTPNLDKLAADGVAFDHAYNMGGLGGAVCVTSRAAMLSGLSMHKLGNKGNQLLEKNVTMGTRFGKAGYNTYGIGKWHNGIPGYMRSFQGGAEILFGGMTADQFNVPLNNYRADGNYTRSREVADPNPENMPEFSDHVYKGKHSSEIFADAAVKYIKDQKETTAPYFLYVAFTAPHDPRQTPDDIKAIYKDTSITLPLNFIPEHPFDNGHTGRDEKLLPTPRDPEKVKEEIRDYYGIITHLDREVGRIIQTLKDSGQYDNTILIFSADNGLSVGQHGLLGKQSLYDHSIRVPLIWKGAGADHKIEKSHARVYLSDIFNTLCDVLKIKAPASTDGKSFADIVSGKADQFRDLMYFSFREIHRAVGDSKYKLIEYNVNGKRTTQLFDLQNDPLEVKNLADDPQFKDTVEKYRKLLLEEKAMYNDNGEFWKGF